MPCTEIALTGSSILNTFSITLTDVSIIGAAIAPMTTADQGSTKATGAVMPTSPARAPLQATRTSVFPVRTRTIYIATTDPVAPARRVLIAFSPMESPVLMLNPNQPKNRMNVPITTKGTLWPNNVLAEPSALYFPMRGPTTAAPARATKPPTACTTPEPA